MKNPYNLDLFANLKPPVQPRRFKPVIQSVRQLNANLSALESSRLELLQELMQIMQEEVLEVETDYRNQHDEMKRSIGRGVTLRQQSEYIKSETIILQKLQTMRSDLLIAKDILEKVIQLKDLKLFACYEQYYPRTFSALKSHLVIR